MVTAHHPRKDDGLALRQEALQALMAGDVATAQSILAPTLPDLLTAECVQVGVLRCPPGSDTDLRRRRVWDVCERALAGRALVSLSPHEPCDVVVLHPMGERGGLRGELAQALRRLFSPSDGMMVGVGQPTPWGHTLEGHVTAVQHRLQPAHGKHMLPPVEVTGPLWMRLAEVPEAQEWAAMVLRAVADTGLSREDQRALLLEGMLTLSLGPTDAARAVAAGRGTVGSGRRNRLSERLTQLQGLTKLSDSVPDRAVLALALRLHALSAPQPPSFTARAGAFEDIRTCLKAREWAEDLLSRLGQEQLHLLTVWFREGGTAAAAAALGRTERTVRNRITDVSSTLSRSLLGQSKADLYEVLLAVIIADDELARSMVHDPAAPAAASRPSVPKPLVGARWGAVVTYQTRGTEEDEKNAIWRRRDIEFFTELNRVMPLAAIFDAIRGFRRRATTWAAGRGIRQYVDVGALPPKQPYLHGFTPPEARWICADDDPFVLMNIEEFLPTPPFATHQVECMALDPLDPERMLDDLTAKDFDLAEPVALVYGKGSNELTPELVARTTTGLAPGSVLILAQLADGYEDLKAGLEMMRQARMSDPVRPYDELVALFDGLEIADPGLVPISDWHREMAHIEVPESHPSVYAAAAIVPGGVPRSGDA